ncbi:DUF1993 domain-containing protein [Methylomonas sp. EFPC1]|uniref:DUF1993 domain-containing protein n=1 Tax=Methylomonas sp. EFPC1 TaxID=2812647 RepID=UPI001968036F|nr:DUF1993 domain-containing protein [Methylomonas sp. EFPC1]QSB01232.1 DUF1993 domain-containing protein [Methylomonas sp. EFPC1]
MSIDMYQVSIKVFIKMLGNLSKILDKAAIHAEAKNIDQSVFINYRLAPDMFPLSKQVQIATDMVKGCAARLAGLEIPCYEDNETTFADLQARISKTIAFIQDVTPAQINGNENLAISFKIGGTEKNFVGLPYLLDFVLPNFYFHITMSYAILRHNGVELGKSDFLGVD